MSDSKDTLDLDLLLNFTSPKSLKRTLQTTLFSYLMEINVDLIPMNFKDVVEDHYYMMEFLDMLEKQHSSN